MDFAAKILAEAEEGMVLVSACLAGEKCRYDGGATPHPLVLELLARGRVVAVCPEMLGGLGAPREPVELVAGRALCPSGRDVTPEFEAGVRLGLAEALGAGCRAAVLKARSPSCGVGRVYDGSFSGRLIPGYGMFAAALGEHGLFLCTELDLGE